MYFKWFEFMGFLYMNKTNWQIKKLNDVCDLITCGVAARPHYVDEGVPFLSAKNVLFHRQATVGMGLVFGRWGH